MSRALGCGVEYREVFVLLRRRGHAAVRSHGLDPKTGDAITRRGLFVCRALLSRDTRYPGHAQNGVLIVHQLLGDFFKLRAADVARGVEECAQSGDPAQICIDAELQIERVTVCARAQLQRRQFVLAMRNGNPGR